MFDSLKNLGNLGTVFKKAEEMTAKLKAVKEELRTRRVSGSAGADMVRIEVNGAFELVSCQIDPSLLKADDREMLEDLIVAATNQALSRAKDVQVEAIRSVTGNLPLPPEMTNLFGAG